ncbi:hypothetical protein IMSAGC007_02936 [Lachnospiraceae bacterium]|jgi:NTP pyrophosphatase (non-canonical NTP hydrolase)|nr:hypothetical protein IMSAGC007_02936 [Lachnospiraceae bacterium]
MDNTQLKLLYSLSERKTLDDVQIYVSEVMKFRGFTSQSAQDKLMLLMEELGELAKAIRKAENYLPIDKELLNNYSSVNEEVADVFIVLLSLCDVLNINLWEAFLTKEKENITRRWSE